MRRLAGERGIVLSFVIKLVLAIAVLGLVLVEGGSVLFARLRAQDVAETAASVAAGELASSGDVRAARDAAKTAIADKDPRVRLRRIRARPDGTVRVTVSKRASTILIQHIGFLEGFAIVKASAAGQPPAV